MKKAFTLIELLIVVLIIGVLTAIALPMYQGAVDKSHWSTLLPAAKAIKDAEETYKMTNGEYTEEMDNLTVDINNTDLNFTLQTPNNTSQPNVIRVTSAKLPTVRLSSYLSDSPMFAGQLHCEANDGKNGRGAKLCGKLLQGQELNTEEGYMRYLLDQSIDKTTCGIINKSWSTSKTKCYKDTATRCTDLGMPAIAGQDQCGYTNVKYATIHAEGACLGTADKGCWGAQIYDGAKCIGSFDDGCRESKIYNGGVCEGKVWGGCVYSNIYEGGQCIGDADRGCFMARVHNGGVCVANKANACFDAHINDGAKCVANVTGGCYRAIYSGTGCCEGEYCPADAPKC